MKFSTVTHPNQWVVVKLSQKNHSSGFVSLTDPCKGSLLLIHIFLNLRFLFSQCENQNFDVFQNAPPKVSQCLCKFFL